MILSAEQKKEYSLNGCIFVKNVFKEKELESLFNSFCKLFLKYNPKFQTSCPQYSSWIDSNLHLDIIYFRKNNPKLFGLFYDSLKLCYPLKKIFYESSIVELAAELLNDSCEGICLTGEMLRLDTPSDNRNNLNWHQDSAYYPQNQYGINGLVCWIPVLPVRQENGSIQFLPGSHKEGKLDLSGYKKDGITSEQYYISEDLIQKYNPVSAIAETGDALFFNMDMIHKSGFNQTEKIRIVAGCRYHRMLSTDFASGELRYVHTKI